MKQTATSPIPLITADLITAVAAIAKLQARDALRMRCHVVQRIAERGASVDGLTVGEFLHIVQEARHATA